MSDLDRELVELNRQLLQDRIDALKDQYGDDWGSAITEQVTIVAWPIAA